MARKTLVLTGNLTNVPQSCEIFDGLTKIHPVRFHVPEHAEFATALGAAIAYVSGGRFTEI